MLLLNLNRLSIIKTVQLNQGPLLKIKNQRKFYLAQQPDVDHFTLDLHHAHRWPFILNEGSHFEYIQIIYWIHLIQINSENRKKIFNITTFFFSCLLVLSWRSVKWQWNKSLHYLTACRENTAVTAGSLLQCQTFPNFIHWDSFFSLWILMLLIGDFYLYLKSFS